MCVRVRVQCISAPFDNRYNVECVCVCVCKESVNANVCMAYQSQDTPYILKMYIRMCVCVQTRM